MCHSFAVCVSISISYQLHDHSYKIYIYIIHIHVYFIVYRFDEMILPSWRRWRYQWFCCDQAFRCGAKDSSVLSLCEWLACHAWAPWGVAFHRCFQGFPCWWWCLPFSNVRMPPSCHKRFIFLTMSSPQGAWRSWLWCDAMSTASKNEGTHIFSTFFWFWWNISRLKLWQREALITVLEAWNSRSLSECLMERSSKCCGRSSNWRIFVGWIENNN